MTQKFDWGGEGSVVVVQLIAFSLPVELRLSWAETKMWMLVWPETESGLKLRCGTVGCPLKLINDWMNLIIFHFIGWYVQYVVSTKNNNKCFNMHTTCHHYSVFTEELNIIPVHNSSRCQHSTANTADNNIGGLEARQWLGTQMGNIMLTVWVKCGHIFIE